jgi:hypothetical protein
MIMPLIPQQDIVVITGEHIRDWTALSTAVYPAAVDRLKELLEGYPPCRIVSLTCSGAGPNSNSEFTLVAVVETI